MGAVAWLVGWDAGWSVASVVVARDVGGHSHRSTSPTPQNPPPAPMLDSHVAREDDHGHEDGRQQLLCALQVARVRPDDEAQEGAHAGGQRQHQEVPQELGRGEVEADEEEDEERLRELVGGREEEGRGDRGQVVRPQAVVPVAVGFWGFWGVGSVGWAGWYYGGW